MHRIQKEKESYEQARQDVNEELKNHKANVKRDIINEYVPDASAYQKEILNDVLDDYDHVAQTYHTILLEAQAEFREKYNRQYQNVKQAEKNGVSIPYVSMDGVDSNVITPEAERMRVIAYNRQLEKESVHNDPEATLMIDQTYDEMEQASKSIRDIEGLEGAVDEIAKGDVAMRMNFSKDGYQVFQDVYNTLRQSPNREVAKQAKEGALLFASHADVMANIMKTAGKWNFTAKDYMDRYISIQMGDTKQIKNGFTQPLNPGVDLKTKVNIVDITTPRTDIIHKMNNSELANYLRKKFTGSILSKDKLATLGIKDYKGAKHLAWNFTQNKSVHRSALDNLESVIENSVLIESRKNIKKDFTTPISERQKRKNEVEFYHRFYVPIRLSGSVYVLRIIGEERQNKITLNPTQLDLYSVIIENKKKERGLQTQSDKSVADAPDKITIQEMLSGVKDMNGNSYIDSNEHSEYYQSQQSGVTKQRVVEAKEKLKADTEAWGTLIDAFKANKVTGNRHRVMSMPLVYQMIGMSNKDIYIENNIINKVINKKHANKIKLELVKQLPEALAHPIAVFKNYDPKKDQVKSNSFISIIEIKSEEGKLTNIPIVFDKNKNGNFIMSIFPREHDTWYEQQLKHDRLLYIDRTKKDSISVGGKSKPSHTEMLSIDDSIPNEEDLRKLKEENTSYYQSQPSGVTKQQVVEAKAKLKADTANWSKVIDNLDSYDAGMQVRVMTTPLALQLAGAKPYEVVMGVGKIRKIMKEHPEITKAGIKNLIQQLSDPIAVFESKTQKGSIIAMVQLKYPVNNANVIIPIKLDADSSRGTYKVNVITSTYARYNKKTLDPSISWYKNILEGKAEKACYLNTKKITDWYSVNRLQLPSTEYHISDFFTYTIPNEEDLRKLKEENTSYYQSVRGVTSMYDDGRKLVELFDSANFSTFVHESGHVFLEDLRMLANMEGAPREVVRDWEAIKTWTGYQEGADADTNRTAHERFAQGFEAYVRDGSAPTKSLQRAFRQFAKWLTKLYQKVSMLGGLPPKEIREVMDRMLATEQDIESWANEREVERLETNDHMQNLSEQEQALLHDKVASIKERAKEKVRAEYMKEMEEQKKVPWEDVKGEAQARIEKGLVERYSIYRERARYEAFGIELLTNRVRKKIAYKCLTTTDSLVHSLCFIYG